MVNNIVQFYNLSTAYYPVYSPVTIYFFPHPFYMLRAYKGAWCIEASIFLITSVELGNSQEIVNRMGPGISCDGVKWSRLWKIQFNCRCFQRNPSLLVSKGVSDENFWQMPPIKKRLRLSTLMHSLVKGNLKWVKIRSGNLICLSLLWQMADVWWDEGSSRAGMIKH